MFRLLIVSVLIFASATGQVVGPGGGGGQNPQNPQNPGVGPGGRPGGQNPGFNPVNPGGGNPAFNPVNPGGGNPGFGPGGGNPGFGPGGNNPGGVGPGRPVGPGNPGGRPVGPNNPGGNPGFGGPGGRPVGPNNPGNPGFGGPGGRPVNPNNPVNPGGNPGFGNPGFGPGGNPGFGNPGFGPGGNNPGFGQGGNPGFGRPGAGNPGFGNPGFGPNGPGWGPGGPGSRDGGRDKGTCGCCNGLFGGITGSSPLPMPKDCRDIKDLGGGKDGIYTIWPTYSDTCEGVKVWCDQQIDGGGWLVFQRRTDGRADFFRGWEEYKNGFGKLSQEFYLGNELIHHLAMGDRYELRVDLQDFQFNEVHARYFRFSLDDESTNYTMNVAGFDPSSDAGDALSGHNGQPFSTFDNDNDRWTKNCAQEYGGAWWYTSCHNSNLNGLYLRGPTREYAKGVVWNQWRGYSYSLKRTEMKMRPFI